MLLCTQYVILSRVFVFAYIVPHRVDWMIIRLLLTSYASIESEFPWRGPALRPPFEMLDVGLE